MQKETEAAPIGSRQRRLRLNRKHRELVELEAIGEALGGTRSWRDSEKMEEEVGGQT